MDELLRARGPFRLDEIDCSSTPGIAAGKKRAGQLMVEGAEHLGALQERLFAASRVGDAPHRVLLVLQAMDTAGKGGIVRHVVGAVDPQGVQLTAFKKPTPDELAHHFLWRIKQQLPSAGMIGVFDRSHYEDVLIGRVRELAPAVEIERRYGEIVNFERRLADDGVAIIKVMLHISGKEQKARLGVRLARPDKHWKYRPGDIDERMLWPDYQRAYQLAIERTDADHAPWYVVPANHKWYARLAVQTLLISALERIDPQWPVADFDVAVEKARLATT